MDYLPTKVFFMLNGDQIVNLVISKNQFFINHQGKIMVSLNRITKIEVNKEQGNSTFYYEYGQENKTNSCIVFPFTNDPNDYFTQLPILFSKAVEENEKEN